MDQFLGAHWEKMMTDLKLQTEPNGNEVGGSRGDYHVIFYSILFYFIMFYHIILCFPI